MSQRGAEEVVELPTDEVSNSICSSSAGGSVGVPRCNLASCFLVTEEMFGLLISEASGRSMKRESSSPFLLPTPDCLHLMSSRHKQAQFSQNSPHLHVELTQNRILASPE